MSFGGRMFPTTTLSTVLFHGSFMRLKTGMMVRVFRPFVPELTAEKDDIPLMETYRMETYYCLEDVFNLMGFFPAGGPGTFGKQQSLLREIYRNQDLMVAGVHVIVPGGYGTGYDKECECFHLEAIYEAIEVKIKDSPECQKIFDQFDWKALTDANFKEQREQYVDQINTLNKKMDKNLEKRTRTEAFLMDLKEDKIPTSKRARTQK